MWTDLSMKDKSDLMSLFLKQGISSLSDMKRIYDGTQDIEEYNGGIIKESKVSASLNRNQWNNLYRQGKVRLSEIPRKYQSWIEGENSQLKKGVTNTISNAGKTLNKVAMITTSMIPVVGVAEDIVDIGTQLASGNYLGAGITAATAVLPDVLGKPIKKLVFNKQLNRLMSTPEFNYKVREYNRNAALKQHMDFGKNSNILVHGDPAGIGVKKVGEAIGYSDGKLTSFPHFENDYFVPGKGNPIIEVYPGGRNQIINDRPIFWGDGKPFYETRVGNEAMFNDDEYINYLATKGHKHAENSPNEFILESPYRYIATDRAATNSPVTTRTGVTRDMSEIQTKEVPIESIWGLEWFPLTQTWGKTIYSPKGSFKKHGGLLHKYSGEDYIINGGKIKPATITEKLERKWDNFYWQKFREPKDFSDEIANTNECAKWSNEQLRKNGYNIWGDAWTRSNQKVNKVFSGYDGLTKPNEYTYRGYKDYVLGAADNVKKNFNWRDLQENDIVGMYFRGSPNYQKAFINGVNGEAQTHTGHIVYRKGKPYVAHNVHGDIKLNKAKKVIGRNHPYGIVSVYRPYSNGGFLQNI